MPIGSYDGRPMRWLVFSPFCLVLLMAFQKPEVTSIMEICDNLIDDDLDGMIDGFDEDCTCSEQITLNEYVINSEFDAQSGCCQSLDDEDTNGCIPGWDNVVGSPDIYHTSCSSPLEFESVEMDQLEPFNDNFMSMGFQGTYTETLGSCLQSQLIQGSEYTIEIDLSIPSDLLTIIFEEKHFTVFGIESCPQDFSDLGVFATAFCDTPISSLAQPLITVGTDDVPLKSMETFVTTFVANQNIEAIIIALDCDLSNPSGFGFVQIGRVQIYDEALAWTFPEISIANNCSSSTALLTPFSDTVSYQWYVDSLPIEGENSNTFLANTEIYGENAEYFVQVSNSNGCLIKGPVSLNPEVINMTSSINICSGSNFEFGSQSIDTEGQYVEIFVTENECDSIVSLTVTVTPPLTKTLNVSVCSEEGFLFEDTLLTQAGLYIDTLKTQDDCDSIVTLNIGLNNFFTFDVDSIICEGDIFQFGELTLQDSGFYIDTFERGNNCDSIVHLDLLVQESLELSQSHIICEGDLFEFGEQTLSSEGVYFESFPRAEQCDSTVVLTLTLEERPKNITYAEICNGDEYSFGAEIYTMEGMHIDTFATNGPCDSISILELIVNEENSTILDIIRCEDDPILFAGNFLSMAGTYYDTIRNQELCDSTVILNLLINENSFENVEHSICENEDFPFGEQTLNTEGTYEETFVNSKGCDSTVLLDLIVTSTIQGDTLFVNLDLGESYLFHGNEYNSEGVFTELLIGESGCDSLTFLKIEFNRSEKIYVANVISKSPINSQMIISSTDDLFIEKYSIFDRWGNLVFLSENFDPRVNPNFWSGLNSNGNRLTSGVYVYHVQFTRSNSSSKEFLFGDVTLLE